MIEEEIWKEIPDFPGYEASSLGKIRNKRGKILKPRIHYARGGKVYWRIDLGRKNRTLYIHRLICYTFRGPPPEEGMEAGHLDDDGNNNAEKNILWLTKGQNQSMKWTNHKTKDHKWGCTNCPCLEETHDESGQCQTEYCPCKGFKRRRIKDT